MQLMPDTAEGLGVDYADPRDNIRGGTKYLKQQLDTFNGDLPKALAAYNAGPGAVEKYGGIPPYEETQNYVKSIMGGLEGGGSYDLSAFQSKDKFSAFENPNTNEPIVDPVHVGAGTRFADSFQDGVYDTTLAGISRTLWSGIGTGSTLTHEEGKPRFTKDEFDWVVSELPNDPIAQQFVLLNSRNGKHLASMVALKKEDAARRQRVQDYMENGKSSLFGFKYDPASVLGMVGSTVADPLTYLPLVQEAKAVQMLERLGGKLGRAVSSSTLLSRTLKYSELAASNAMLNVGERKLSELTTGYQQHYEIAAIMGGVAGAGLGMLGDAWRFMKNSKGGQGVYNALQGTEDAATRMAADIDPVDVISRQKTRDILQGFSENARHVDSIVNPHMKQILTDGGAHIIKKENIAKVAEKLGIEIDDGAAAFFHNGHAVAIPENIKPGSTIEDALRHDIVAHGELRNTVGEETWGKLLGTAQKYMDGTLKAKQGSAWQKALKSMPEGADAEEMIGYFLQHSTGRENIFKSMKAGINETMRKLGKEVDFSDAEIKSLADQALKNAAERKGAITELPDGSSIQGGIRYSNQNAFGTHIFSKFFDLENGVLARTQGAFKPWFQKIGKSMEAGWFFGNDRGIVSNSNAVSAGNIMKLLVNDERHRATDITKTVESMKDYMKDSLNTTWSQYLDIRSKAILGSTGYVADLKAVMPWNIGRINSEYKAFDREVREAYNYHHADKHGGVDKGWHPDVIQAANAMKQLRDEIVEVGRKSAEMFGLKTKNMIDEDWTSLDNELWRVIDDDSWQPFVNRFADSGLEKKFDANGKLMDAPVTSAVGFLTKYAREAVKRKVVVKRLMRDKMKVYTKELEKWEETVEGLAEGVKPPPKPRKPKLKDEEVDEWIEKETRDWAYGIVDQDNSNIRHTKKDWEENSVSFLRERLPMNTAHEMEIPNSKGTLFSFDNNLRSDDLDFIVPRVIDRFTGEAAFRNHFPTEAHWTGSGKNEEILGMKTKLMQEHGHAVTSGGMTAARAKKVEKALDNIESTLRGTRNKEIDPPNIMNLFGNIIRTLSYGSNSGNMGLMQMGEVAGALGNAGGRAIPYMLPGLGDYLSKRLDGKAMQMAIKDAEGFLFGEIMDDKMFRTSFRSKAANEVTTREDDVLRKTLNATSTVANAAGRIATTANLLPHITDSMVRGVRKVFIGDSIRWAQGEVFGKAHHAFIDPFSKKKMVAAGITPEMQVKLKADINKYTKLDAEGKPVDMDMMGWRDASPDTFFAYRNWLDLGSRRAITQASVGNRNYLKDSNIFFKTFFQFKDFTLKGVNGQLLRALTNREIEDGYTAILSMGTNMAAYYAVAHGKAWMKYPNDKQKRDAELEQTTSWGKLGTAAVVRSVMLGSVGSFANDGYEMISGAQHSLRTTVDRSRKAYQPQERKDETVVGELVTQTPSWRTLGGLTYTPYQMAKKAIDPNAHITEYDAKEFLRNLPLSNWMPMMLIQSLTLDGMNLPKKDIKKP